MGKYPHDHTEHPMLPHMEAKKKKKRPCLADFKQPSALHYADTACVSSQSTSFSVRNVSFVIEPLFMDDAVWSCWRTRSKLPFYFGRFFCFRFRILESLDVSDCLATLRTNDRSNIQVNLAKCQFVFFFRIYVKVLQPFPTERTIALL